MSPKDIFNDDSIFYGERTRRELHVMHETDDPNIGPDAPGVDLNRNYAALLQKAAQAVAACELPVEDGRVFYTDDGVWHFQAEVSEV